MEITRLSVDRIQDNLDIRGKLRPVEAVHRRKSLHQETVQPPGRRRPEVQEQPNKEIMSKNSC